MPEYLPWHGGGAAHRSYKALLIHPVTTLQFTSKPTEWPFPDQQDSRSKHLLRLVLAIVVVLVGVTNGITTVANGIAKTTTAESDLTHGTALRYHAEIRELSDHDFGEERKGGGGGGRGRGKGSGRGGGGRGTTSGPIYGTHTSIGFMKHERRHAVREEEMQPIYELV
ncbi:hypothetical protein GQ600_2432 [Phytophthora cactorum]|nr:hypothetical protein GQ600_2432 [Phytophthora cactorum]